MYSREEKCNAISRLLQRTGVVLSLFVQVCSLPALTKSSVLLLSRLPFVQVGRQAILQHY